MSDHDLLIGRIVDREDSPSDWLRFESLAADDTLVRDHLFAALRDETLLRSAVDHAVTVADRVDIDLGLPTRHPSSIHGSLIHWGGWMAAAVLVLIWMATDPRMKRTAVATGPEPLGPVTQQPVTQQPATQQPATQRPETAANAQLVDNTFVRDLPHVMVETRRIPDSDQTEVFYVRRVLERTVVSGAYTMAMDETGQPVRVQADLTQFTPKQRY